MPRQNTRGTDVLDSASLLQQSPILRLLGEAAADALTRA